MTQPETLPLAPMREILSKDGICLCAKCGYLGTGSEFTVSNYPADDYSSCCPKCDNSDEERLVSAESISDALCSPDKPEAEAVAQLEVRNGIASLKHLLVHIDDVSDGMMLYRSPPAASTADKLRRVAQTSKLGPRVLPCKQCGAKYESDKCTFPNDCHVQRAMVKAPEALLSQEPSSGEAIVQANVQCNACHRSLVGVTTGNFGCDRVCKPHGFACGLYGLKPSASPVTGGEDKQ